METPEDELHYKEKLLDEYASCAYTSFLNNGSVLAQAPTARTMSAPDESTKYPADNKK